VLVAAVLVSAMFAARIAAAMVCIEEGYQAQVIPNFKWAEWVDPAKVMTTPHRRVDVDYKNGPYRGRPIEGPQP
jgi:hypothetical protein